MKRTTLTLPDDLAGRGREVADSSFVNPMPEDYARGSNTVQSLGDQNVTLVDATIAALAIRMGLDV